VSKLKNIDVDLLKKLIVEGKNVWEISKIFSCGVTTVFNYIKKYGIEKPKGLMDKGRKAGRPKGFKHSENWIENQRKLMLEKNPFKGKHHDEDTKLLMSKNHANITGDRNPFKNSLKDPQKRKEHKTRCKDLWKNRDENYRDEFGKKVSKGLCESEKFQDIKFHKNKNYRSEFVETRKAGKVFCRSSWEKKICESLDNNVKVKEFKLEPFYVPYVNEKGKSRYSRIDFLVTMFNERKAILEIKPIGMESINNNKCKILGYKDYCRKHGIQFMWINETHLDKLDEVIHLIESGGLYV